MKLASVIYGKVFSHRDGDESEIVYNTSEYESTVPMPDWAITLRENNIAKGLATEVLIWDYDLKQFDKVPVLPNFQVAVNELWTFARGIRNKLLQATDWMLATADSTFSTEQLDQIAKYREDLRNFSRSGELNSAEKITEYFNKFNKLPNPAELIPPNPGFIDSNVMPILKSFTIPGLQ